MAKYGAAGTVTGQAFRVKEVETEVANLPFPVVSAADLLRKDHAINIADKSGKQKGAMVLVKGTGVQLFLAVATGSLPESNWKVMELATDITPVA